MLNQDLTPNLTPNSMKIGLIGCGAVVERLYGPALKELERLKVAKVVSAVDRDSRRLEYLKSVFPGITCGQDISSLCDNGVELAIIASPVSFHAEQAITLLRSGVNVLCEKPMAATVAEAEDMIRVAREAQSLLAVGFFRRYLPVAQTVKQLIVNKTFGEVKSFYFCEGGKFDWPVHAPFISKDKRSHGGVLLDLGIHLVDLMVWWFGEPVNIDYEDDNMGGVELNARLKVIFKEGFQGQIRLSWDWPLPYGCVIECEKGWIKFNIWNDGKLECGFYGNSFGLDGVIRENKAFGGFPALGDKGVTYSQSFVTQLGNVIKAIQGRESMLVPGEEGIKSLKVVERCYKHRTLMDMPWLSEKEQCAALKLSPGGAL